VDDAPIPERPAPPLTWRDVIDRWLGPLADAPWRVLGAVAGLAVVALAGWWVLRPPALPPVEASLPLAPAAAGAGAGGGGGDAPATTTTAAPELVVHAAGAVAVPGVHRVPAGARVADLLAAAGGPSADADLDRVNLAAPLADGERVWFPRVGEEVPPAVAGSAGAGEPASTGPVDLNTAGVEELDALPGVGPSIAAAIVEHRERNGPFRSVDDLLDVPGIGPAKLEALRDLVTV